MITGSDEDASEVPLQLARDAYVVELDREIGGDDGRRTEL